jgi:enoyl-[acyl-carrier protein] reductase/trans-2-enoyl-CoA reductase (NAD+)
MIIKPRVRGFICVTTHPAGCEANVQEQIDYVTASGPIADGPRKVLVIGASTVTVWPPALRPHSVAAPIR